MENNESTNKALPPAEVAQLLGTFSAFLRTDTNGIHLASEVDGATGSARMSIEGEEVAQDEADDSAQPVPNWGKDIPNTTEVFVEPTETTDMWHISAEPTSGSMEVKYEYADEILVPGAGKNEQAIELSPIDNRFSLDEWNLIAQPILERFTKALELRKFSKLAAKGQKKFEKRVKGLLPQVFQKEEIENFGEIESNTRAFSAKINELLNEINTNPDVLKGWIKATLEKTTPAPITASKKGAKEYEKMHTGAARKRLLQRFKKSEDSLENYVDDLADKISKIGEQLLRLNYYHGEGLYGVAEVKKDFEETPYMQKKLHELTEKIARQLERKKGMVSMIGDMGTGKNYLVEHFAAKSNRPFFYFPCSRGMDAADLGFHFEFRKGESFVVPSNLAKGLKTKNACILIDEPNSLPPEVVAGLHGLADHNRAFVYNGVTFEAAEGVVVVMTMNPATYEHVKDMPEAMSDRTLGQDMLIDYPPFTKLDELTQNNLWSEQEAQNALQADNSLDKFFECDEALILRNYIPQLKDWSQKEFAHLWNVIINDEGEGILGEKAHQAELLRPFVEAIFNILKVCHKWRKKYKAGDMSRTISLRGSIAVVENYLHTKNVKKAFLDLYKPNSMKYDGGQEDYETLEEVMNDMQELEMSVNEAI